ncbi:MAG: NAD(P)-binding domain-containing protein [Chloroflexi bacterium]|nr:NAD(P)-binding domain-containing protein [Chloroflexota bacterium]
MKIGIIGAGNIGGNAARLWSRAGHEVLVSFSRDPSALEALSRELRGRAHAGTPREAVEFGEVVMLSVPWSVIPLALDQAGSLDGKVVIDTTNQFGRGGVEMPPHGMSAAEFNVRRMPGARPVKSYNTLTAGYQAEAAGRSGADRIAMFYAGEDEEAKRTVAGLIADSGFEPVDIGGWAQVRIMEAPRRPGAVYGEAYHPVEARKIAAAVRTDPERAGELARQLRIPD